MYRSPKTILRDEQGGLSMSRTLLLCQLVYVDILAALGAVGAVVLSGQWWTFQGTLVIGLVAWAAGPRGLQYLGPQLGNIGRAIASAPGRLTGTDDAKKDDERGPSA